MIKKSKTLDGIKLTAIVRDAEDITFKYEFPDTKKDVEFLRPDAKEIEQYKKILFRSLPKKLKSLLLDSNEQSSDAFISGRGVGPFTVEISSMSGVKIIDKNGKILRDNSNFSKKILNYAKGKELGQILFEAYNEIFGELKI